MPLNLRLDNVDTLPDGGPVSCEIDRRGLDIGRDPYLDWTLPDPERIISGKHCEIRYRDGGYWLHDVSTNGTTLNGRTGRLTEPYRLEDGDRIHIGNYIVAVAISGEDAPAAKPSGASAPSAGSGDPWGGVDDAAAVVDRRDFAAHARPDKDGHAARTPVDASEENISWSVGRIIEAAPATDKEIWGERPASESETPADEWGWTPPSADKAAPDAPPPPATLPTPLPATGPDGRGAPSSDPFAPAPPDAIPSDAAPSPAAPSPAVSRPAPPSAPDAPSELPVDESREQVAAAPVSASGHGRGRAAALAPAGPAGAGDFIAAFERGAAMPAGSVAGGGEAAFAEELGALFRLVAGNLQAMLAARAETKSAMRSSDRTMIGAMENNPLKFSPTPEDALRIMFGEKTRSYLDARGTVEESFRDLQKHQLQTFAAMQQALQALIEDLTPENIAGATAKDGSLARMVSSRRAKYWDTYVERFNAKSGRHERGMIDAFMILFAETYDRQR